MGGKSLSLGVLNLGVLLLAAAVPGGAVSPPSCEAVRKVFQLRQLGSLRGIPESPRAGVDLQVCTSKNPTCCTKKMEERYQAAAKQDIEEVLQTSSATLKFLISRNAAAFQGFCKYLLKIELKQIPSCIKRLCSWNGTVGLIILIRACVQLIGVLTESTKEW